MAAVSARGAATDPTRESFETWVKEQEAGFGRTRGGRLTAYRVQHPTWRIFPVEEYQLSVDFTHLYGERWQFLQERTPDSVVLAEGSQIAIYPNENR